MSFNQSRSDKSDAQYQKTGRSASSNQQRSSSGSFPKAGGPGPGPSPALSSSSKRSFKKPINVQGGQSRVIVPAENSPSDFGGGGGAPPRSVQNGAHVQPQLHGVSDASASSPAAKPTDPSATQRSAWGVPKAPSSQSTTRSSETKAPTTPSKGDALKPFAFQFGSISPGFMNEMQIPARTSSTPPNLDDQKRDQARHDSFRSVPSLPTLTVPKQQLPRKDASAFDQSNSGVAPPIPMARMEMQVSSAPSATQTQKPFALPMPGISMPLPYNQPLVPVKFGGPNPQMQSQTMTATSLQMSMPIPLLVGSAPQVKQQVFVPGLQPHPLQPQGIMHQGQGLSFTTQMGSQLPPQLGNLGIGISPQYPQQQGGKYGGPRKTTAKITHPDTHEELRLDKRIDTYSDGGSTAKITLPDTHEELRLDKRIDTYSDGGSTGLRSNPTVPPQSQPMPSFAPSHSMNYYTLPVLLEKKYEVGKADEEQAKQRQWKSILNKLRQLKSILNKLRQLKSINELTPQNFKKLFEQVKAVNIDNAITLTGFTSEIFNKALMEPTFCELYANFCCHLAGELPDFSEDNEKITFKRLLLNKCQEEFERGEREQEEANKVDEEGEVKQSEEVREEKRIKSRRRMLGNIRLIGELYKKKMLTERIMHECIKKLLGQYQNPDEEDVEALCELMSTIGEMIDHPKAKEHIDAYFDMMAKLSNNMKLSSRVRFMLKDSIDLRKNKWQQRRKAKGPKKIEEVHRDAAQE